MMTLLPLNCVCVCLQEEVPLQHFIHLVQRSQEGLCWTETRELLRRCSRMVRDWRLLSRPEEETAGGSSKRARKESDYHQSIPGNFINKICNFWHLKVNL